MSLLANKQSSKYLLFFGCCHAAMLPLALLERGTLELPFNLFVAPELFSVFTCITLMGDGWFALVVLILVGIIAKRKKQNLKVELCRFLLISTLMGIGIFVFKQLVFPDVTRPIAFFTPLPEGWNPNDFPMTFHRFRSFPSGHTASAATYGFILMRYFKTPVSRILLYSTILIVGYSRVFLFQHFVADVYAGVVLGLICVWLGNLCTRLIFRHDINPVYG